MHEDEPTAGQGERELNLNAVWQCCMNMNQLKRANRGSEEYDSNVLYRLIRVEPRLGFLEESRHVQTSADKPGQDSDGLNRGWESRQVETSPDKPGHDVVTVN